MSVFNAYIYENLRSVAVLGRDTTLCIYEPAHKLYVVKCVDTAAAALYRQIAALDCPHLAKILYVDDRDGRAIVVRAYLSGDSLADLLRGGRTLSEYEAVKIAAELCAGLEALHGIGLVHRDVNPNNVIVTTDGFARLIDFGIARAVAPEKDTDTVILGTPGYAAPEQFGFRQSDARTDIYAVGVLLNRMLTGKLPNEQLAPGRLGKIVKKCTQIDASKRYKSVSALGDVLRRNCPPPSGTRTLLSEIPGLRSRHIPVVILAAIGYLAAALLMTAMFATARGGFLGFVQTMASCILLFAVPFCCFHNFLGIWNRIPLTRGTDRRTQRILYTVIGIYSIFAGLILFGIGSSP